MNSIQIYLRVKDMEDLECIKLVPVLQNKSGQGDILWVSNGEYFLEAFQCGAHPSICSIEKEDRILNQKEELALMILDELKKREMPSL